jgi:hypothetical protein
MYVWQGLLSQGGGEEERHERGAATAAQQRRTEHVMPVRRRTIRNSSYGADPDATLRQFVVFGKAS